jgi:hypothetical protein
MAEAEQLSAFIADEQATLWHELAGELRHAINGVWSMAASNRCRRIVAAARLVGPTEYGSVPWPLVAGGVYAAVLDAGNVAYDWPDSAEFARLGALMRESCGTVGALQMQHAQSVATIGTDRETAWINGEDE